MSPRMLLIYSVRAVSFAAAVGGLYTIGMLLRHRRLHRRISRRDICGLLLVLWLAAIVHITVIRLGPDWTALADGTAVRQLRLVPLETAVELFGMGLWYGCVEVIGNIICFAPLGLLLPLCLPRLDRFGRVLAVSAGLSLIIELCQLLLATGVADIDDLMLNTLGGLLGYLLLRAIRRTRTKSG